MFPAVILVYAEDPTLAYSDQSPDSVAILLCRVAGRSKVCVRTVGSRPSPLGICCDSERFTSLFRGSRGPSSCVATNGCSEPAEVAIDLDARWSRAEGLDPRETDQLDSRCFNRDGCLCKVRVGWLAGRDSLCSLSAVGSV